MEPKDPSEDSASTEANPLGQPGGQPGGQPTPPSRSFLVGYVVIGAVAAFAALLFLANFSETSSSSRTPTGDDPFAAFGKRKVHKVKRGKSKVSEDRWVTGQTVDRAKAPEGAKNVVVVITTSIRKDALTPYGAPPNYTPFLQELANQGARFADAISTSSAPRSAAAALVTGQHALTLDLVEPGPGPETKVLAGEVETLAERLQAAGWTTVGVTANPHLATETGLAQGFDRFRDCEPNGFHPASRLDGKTVIDEALRALDGLSADEQARPFFLQLDLIDAHGPLLVVPSLEPEFEPERPNVAYRVAVNRVDNHVRTLVEALHSRGFDYHENTILVVISDHGEGNQDPAHHGPMHGRLLYESTIAIPFIVAGPGVPPNRVIGGLASQTDLMPTVLGLVGLEGPRGIDGVSHTAALRGEGERTARDRAFADTWYQSANRAAIWTDTMQCQKDFGTTEGTDAFADGCYDRRVDPEFRNLLKNEALTAELEAWRAEQSKAVTPSNSKPPAPQAPVVEGEHAG